MERPSIHCPECGAPATFRGAALTVVCEYCGATIVRTGADISLIGKVSAILDNGSPIVLGGRGKVDGLPFEIVGRLQLRHLRGTWNEWYLLFADQRDGWLADAQGSFYLVRRATAAAAKLPAFDELALGQRVTLGETTYAVTERRRATYQGAEGSLPFAATPGRAYASVDLLGEEGEFMTIDYGDGDGARAPEIFTGSAVELADLAIHPLRRFEGWEGPGNGGWEGPGGGG